MNPLDGAELFAQLDLVQQALMVAAGAIVVVGFALYVVLTALKRDQT